MFSSFKKKELFKVSKIFFTMKIIKQYIFLTHYRFKTAILRKSLFALGVPLKLKTKNLLEYFERFAHLLFCAEWPERIPHIRSFLVSNMSESLIFGEWPEQIAHFLWATWANRSWSLIFHVRPERFAHSRSFVLSDLSESLMVAHLFWAIWANSQPCHTPFTYPPPT